MNNGETKICKKCKEEINKKLKDALNAEQSKACPCGLSLLLQL